MKTLIVLSLALAITSNAAPKAPPVMPPMPKLVVHRPVARSPKAISLLPRRFVAVVFDNNRIITHLFTTNGITVDIVQALPTRTKSLALIVPPTQLRAINPPEYQHASNSGNSNDYCFVSYTGMITNHTYRFNWINTCPPQHGSTTTDWNGQFPLTRTVWTGLNCRMLACVTWGVDSGVGTQLRFGMPVANPVPPSPAGINVASQGFFRLEDVTGH